MSLPLAAPSSRLPAMRTIPTVFRAAAIAVLALACTACGFHLRNALTLPPELNPVRVVAPDPYSPLAQSLADAMSRAGATPADDALEEATTLQIFSERWGVSPISIDQNGRAQEYALRYAVVFALIDASGNMAVPEQAVELSREYVAPPTDTTGEASERELLSRELRREMSSAILRRIGAALRVTRPAENDRRGTAVEGTGDGAGAATP